MSIQRKPHWLQTSFATDVKFAHLRYLQENAQIATVCQEARCPNRGECWSSGTATFMLMGEVCTRACRFCSVKTAKNPDLPNPKEAVRLAKVIQQLNLKFVVLTSVTRDDLPDQGVAHLIDCINAVKKENKQLYLEVLVPDFQGDTEAFSKLARSEVNVISHNVETVERLTPIVRDKRADYKQSLAVLAHVKKEFPRVYSKSSLMLGLGETEQEIRQTLYDMREANIDFVTIGQYLQPSKYKLAVQEYVTPEKFKQWEEECYKLGFTYAVAAPLARSSYKAGAYFFDSQRKEAGEV